MSAQDGQERRAPAAMTRREMVSALARWTVPTVVTLSLATRSAYAASCPPCTKKVGGACRACTVSQILNCQCEPCLGPPYCSSSSPTSPFRTTPDASLGGGLSGPAPAGQEALGTWLRQRAARERSGLLPGLGARADSGLAGGLRTPFGQATPRSAFPGGLYERLRPPDERRRP